MDAVAYPRLASLIAQSFDDDLSPAKNAPPWAHTNTGRFVATSPRGVYRSSTSDTGVPSAASAVPNTTSVCTSTASVSSR
jgi:hypothetical protein